MACYPNLKQWNNDKQCCVNVFPTDEKTPYEQGENRMEIRTWWDALSNPGPDFGYFPNDRKCWIVAKPAKEESVREAFKDTSINVTVQGQKHLGASIGSREYLEEYVSEKVTN